MLSVLILSLSAHTSTVTSGGIKAGDESDNALMDKLRTRLTCFITASALGVCVAVMAAPMKWG